jgi:hypothetical protein
MKLALVWLATGVLCGQTVTGTVKETGTGQPIAAATIKVNLVPDPPPQFITAATYRNPDITVTTGIDGGFSFDLPRFGKVRLRVEMEGFGSGTAMLKPPTDQAEVTVDKDHPTRSVDLTMARPAYLTARVIDEETRKPVSKVPLLLHQLTYFQGYRRLLFAPGSGGETDAEGRFTSGKIPPGDYVVTVRPETPKDGAVQLAFQKEDFEATDSDLARTYWPGGKDVDAALPMKVRSGDKLDVGTITVRQTKLYRVKVSVTGAGCAPGEMAQMSRVVRNGLATNQSNGSEVPCRGEFLVTRLQPGTYWFEFQTIKRPLPERERASVQVDVIDRNIEVKATLSRGVDVAGRFTVAEGSSKPEWKGVRLMTRPMGSVPVMSEIPEPPDAEGRFRLVNAAAREYQIDIFGLPSGYYVKEVKYGGVTMLPGWLTLSAGAVSQTLDIVVDDKPAALTGTVKYGDGALVVLVRWPPNNRDFRTTRNTAAADADGKFQFQNQAPGEYRCFAIRATEQDRLEEPYVLDRMLQGAKKVTLTSGGAGTVEMEM